MPDALPLTSPSWVFLVLAAIILVAPIAAERLRLPGIVGLVVFGLFVGPEMMGLLERSGTVEQVGGLGLLYLMFLAGLELDLSEFQMHRRRAVVFGLLTFATPMALGTVSGLALGFAATPAVLLGSLWASHTLIAYPIFRRHGQTGNRAVAVTVAATAITDTLALLVLAGVVRSTETGLGWDFAGKLAIGLAALFVSVLWGLPRLARWFFGGPGQDRVVRFVFVLTASLGAAVLGEVVGVEGIVGSFLAGLALNRLVPNRGALMDRIEFVGSALLIPIFLVSVGMLIDPAVVADLETLRLAAAFTAVALGAKLLAAWGSGSAFGFSSAEWGAMFSLSGAQAAATLAATVVAFEIGIFGEQVVNAVLIVILVTVVVTSWSATRVVGNLPVPQPAHRQLGAGVVVALANPESAEMLVGLAVSIARPDGGVVHPIHIVTDPGLATSELEQRRSMVAEAEALAARAGAEAGGWLRVDTSVAAGVVHTVLERNASLVIIGWQSDSPTRDVLFGSKIDEVVAKLTVPVVVARITGLGSGPVLLGLDDHDLDPLARADLVAAIAVAQRVAKGRGIDPVAIVSVDPSEVPELARLRAEVSGESRLDAVLDRLDGHGTVVLPAARGTRTFGRDALAIADRAPDAVVLVVASGRREPGTQGGRLPDLFGR